MSHATPQPVSRATDEARDALEDMVNQFAYYSEGNLHTGGLSALEDAFDVLGWSDPYPAPWRVCDEPGCKGENTCGWPSPTGYRRTCGEHYRAARLTEGSEAP